MSEICEILDRRLRGDADATQAPFFRPTFMAALTARLVDADGRFVPTAPQTPLDVEVAGPGALIGTGSGDPTSHEVDRPTDPLRGTRTAWHGLARLLVQATGGAGGNITVSVSSESRSERLRHQSVSVAIVSEIEDDRAVGGVILLLS